MAIFELVAIITDTCWRRYWNHKVFDIMSVWWQTSQFLRVAKCSTLYKIEAKINLMIQLKDVGPPHTAMDPCPLAFISFLHFPKFPNVLNDYLFYHMHSQIPKKLPLKLVKLLALFHNLPRLGRDGKRSMSLLKSFHASTTSSLACDSLEDAHLTKHFFIIQVRRHGCLTICKE